MLASVNTPEEAMIALDAGVEIIDLKDPSQGALGALPVKTVEAVVGLINGRAVLSATIGDQPMVPEFLLAEVRKMLATGVDVVKIGFFGHDHHQSCLDALKAVADDGGRLIAVLFADMTPNFELLKKVAEAGFYGVMLDTANKDGRHLMNHCTLVDLREFVDEASKFGLKSGLAGALAKSHVADLLQISPSYLGFRSALCEQSNRISALSIGRVNELAQMLHQGLAQACDASFVNQSAYALI